MIHDTYSQFAINAPLSTPIGTALVGDVVDLGSLGATAVDLNLVVLAKQAITAGSAGTLTLQLVSASTSDFAVPTILTQRSFATGTTAIAAGTKLMDGEMPATTNRYIGLRQVVAGAALTGGSIWASLTPASNSWASLARMP